MRDFTGLTRSRSMADRWNRSWTFYSLRILYLMHHGTIKLYSEEGMGTTFTFRIPLNYVESNDEDKNEN